MIKILNFILGIFGYEYVKIKIGKHFIFDSSGIEDKENFGKGRLIGKTVKYGYERKIIKIDKLENNKGDQKNLASLRKKTKQDLEFALTLATVEMTEEEYDFLVANKDKK